MALARITLNSCPSISAILQINKKKITVSVVFTETGGAYYPTDPSESLRYKLNGEYTLDTLPDELKDAIADSLKSGNFNRGFVGDYFDIEALCLFVPLESWYDDGKEEYYRLLDEAMLKIEQLRIRPDTDRLYKLCYALGLKIRKS